MKYRSIGFIGGGRITQIFLAALKRKNVMPASIVVNEIDDLVINQLKEKFPETEIEKEICNVVKQEYIFISLHPPAFGEVLKKIQGRLNNKSILISLAPKLSCSNIADKLNGNDRIVRMIPNAPTVVNKGYNPVYFSSSVIEKEKEDLLEFFRIFGEAPQVEENKLEAYAILTAMGPTYFWFQFYELKRLLNQFGLDDVEFKTGLEKMLEGSLSTMFSGLNCNEVNDLIPVKPLADYESSIIESYGSSLKNIFNKIRPS